MERKDDMEQLGSKAELLKTLAHPVRLCIIRGLLDEGECNVNKMQACLDIPQSTLSQHLAKMRSAGVVQGRRQGTEVFYQVINVEAAQVVKALLGTEKN
ncbi:MAG TPA: metalloregulator ArsR/SmtB family transcription factor [Bacillota bacterium]|nr:metalloregulator ArsR/SmtB family transcription factor [Bacillota bacterium]